MRRDSFRFDDSMRRNAERLKIRLIFCKLVAVRKCKTTVASSTPRRTADAEPFDGLVIIVLLCILEACLGYHWRGTHLSIGTNMSSISHGEGAEAGTHVVEDTDEQREVKHIIKPNNEQRCSMSSVLWVNMNSNYDPLFRMPMHRRGSNWVICFHTSFQSRG